MATTLRYGNGFRSSNAKYIVRKKTKVHFYEEDGIHKVRVTKSFSFINKENETTLATIDINTDDGETKKYVGIS